MIIDVFDSAREAMLFLQFSSLCPIFDPTEIYATWLSI